MKEKLHYTNLKGKVDFIQDYYSGVEGLTSTPQKQKAEGFLKAAESWWKNTGGFVGRAISVCWLVLIKGRALSFHRAGETVALSFLTITFWGDESQQLEKDIPGV